MNKVLASESESKNVKTMFRMCLSEGRKTAVENKVFFAQLLIKTKAGLSYCYESTAAHRAVTGFLDYKLTRSLMDSSFRVILRLQVKETKKEKE